MARVALCTDRESYSSDSSSKASDISFALNEEFSKPTSTGAAVSVSDLFGTNPVSLKSMAFSLDDEEAQKQAKEYTRKVQEDEYKRKRQLDEPRRHSSVAYEPHIQSEKEACLAAGGTSSVDSVGAGWSHGAEMKFDAKELLATKTVLLSGTSCAAKRAEIREYFHRTFSVYERLFELLSDSSVFYRRPDSLRHPLIFYYGHTAVFFINKLMLGKFISKRIDEKMESTCAVGVDEMSWDDLNDAHYDWPTPEAVRNYRNLVRSTVDDVIQSAPLRLPIRWDSPFWVILMGIEHERIHLETSSVLIRQLPIECVRTHPLWQICPKRRGDIRAVPANRLIALPGGEVQLGKDVHTSVLYGWDNEYGQRIGSVAPFQVSQFLVSNAEWLEFMADGAYDRQEFWSVEGWKFIQFMNAQRKYPIFWVPIDSSSVAPEARAENFRYRALSEIIDMPWDWPVEVNELEAKAFTNWKAHKTAKKIRLPTEDEYNHMRNLALTPQNEDYSLQRDASPSSSTSASDAIVDQPYWNCAPGNINLEWYASSNPIDEFAFKLPASASLSSDSSSSSQLFDVIGNVWQHTETPIAPFAGFQFHPLYDDFSIPTFDNLHNLLMGGSWISTGNESIRSARYAFRRHFYQHAGIRYVHSEENVVLHEVTPSTETDLAVANMAADHYSKLPEPFSQFSNPFIQLARIIMEAVQHERCRFTRTPLNSALFHPRELSAMDLTQLESVAHLPPSFQRVLDLGCGAGRLCFELAFQPQQSMRNSHGDGNGSSFIESSPMFGFESVLGIDLSTRFLRVADSLKHGGKFHYLVKSEGDLDAFHAIDLSDSNSCERNELFWALSHKARQQVCARVEFMQSDAHNFDGKHNDFDVIVLAHLLEEMYEPKRLLDIIHNHCKLGGILVILSDYHWRTAKTEKANWLGGKKEVTGESLNTLNALDTLLANHFVRISKPQNLMQIRRCTDRVATVHQSELTFWRRIK